MRKLFLLFVLITSSNLQAANHCLKSHWILKNEVFLPITQCKLEKTLQLRNIFWNYPKMKNSVLSVNYWEGSYSKKVKVKREFLLLSQNSCLGIVFPAQHFVFDSVENKEFSLINSNLDKNLTKSYETLALTKEEALLALENARLECEEN